MSDTVERAYPEAPADMVKAQRAFNWAIVISGIRCTFAYVVFPFVAPLFGFVPGIGPVLGLTIGTVAIASNLWSLRRFHRSNHRWKTRMTVVHIGVIGLLLVLMAFDVRELLLG
jgi:hypothetical protein